MFLKDYDCYGSLTGHILSPDLSPSCGCMMNVILSHLNKHSFLQEEGQSSPEKDMIE